MLSSAVGFLFNSASERRTKVLRTLILMIGLCFVFGRSAKADCYSDCGAGYAICYASWNFWDAACNYASWDRWQAGDDNCTYGCSYPCDPDFCRAANNADYDAASWYC